MRSRLPLPFWLADDGASLFQRRATGRHDGRSAIVPPLDDDSFAVIMVVIRGSSSVPDVLLVPSVLRLRLRSKHCCGCSKKGTGLSGRWWGRTLPEWIDAEVRFSNSQAVLPVDSTERRETLQ